MQSTYQFELAQALKDAIEMLDHIAKGGSYPAIEFYRHTDDLRYVLRAYDATLARVIEE
jgi:hypothetical protein